MNTTGIWLRSLLLLLCFGEGENIGREGRRGEEEELEEERERATPSPHSHSPSTAWAAAAVHNTE